jgi:hypothetical protein
MMTQHYQPSTMQTPVYAPQPLVVLAALGS